MIKLKVNVSPLISETFLFKTRVLEDLALDINRLSLCNLYS